MTPDSTQELIQPWLLYDKECPFCSAFVRRVRLVETIGTLRLVDAREPSPELEIARKQGYAIDEGMLLALDGSYYYAADCIHRIAMLSTRSGLFNRVNRWVFRSKTSSALLYPILRSGRNLILRLSGRSNLGY